MATRYKRRLADADADADADVDVDVANTDADAVAGCFKASSTQIKSSATIGYDGIERESMPRKFIDFPARIAAPRRS